MHHDKCRGLSISVIMNFTSKFFIETEKFYDQWYSLKAIRTLPFLFKKSYETFRRVSPISRVFQLLETLCSSLELIKNVMCDFEH